MTEQTSDLVSAFRPAGGDWWRRTGLDFENGRLTFAGRGVAELTAEHGGSVLAYDGERIRERIRSVRSAFERAGGAVDMFFAMKANRFRPVLNAVRGDGHCGIDACSPGEVQLALESGFRPEEISFTGSSLSEADVSAIVDLSMAINVNSISTIHKLGRRGVRRPIGLRVNPGIGVGATASLTYAGSIPTKFGIYPERIPEALRLARAYGLEIEGLHMHVGSGWMADGLPTFLSALDRMLQVAEPLGPLRYVNIGGGIGVTHRPDSVPVDLDKYAAGVLAAVRMRVPGARVSCEPGDYIANDAGILGATVTEVEEKGGVLFAALNVGFNTSPQSAHYGFTPTILHATGGPTGPSDRSYCVCGNINEVIDIFNASAQLPDLHEGDVVAILSAGAYASSMGSDHCMRRRAPEFMVRP